MWTLKNGEESVGIPSPLGLQCLIVNFPDLASFPIIPYKLFSALAVFDPKCICSLKFVLAYYASVKTSHSQP